jgi:translocation and assembly module TamB
MVAETPTPSSAPPPVSQAPPTRTPPSLLTPLLWVLLALVLVIGALAGAAAWLLRSEAGALWLLARVPGVVVGGWRGPLLGDGFSAERVQVDWAGGGLLIEQLSADGLRWTWRPDDDAWVGLAVAQLQARRVEVRSGPSSDEPLQAPVALQWPLRLQLDALKVGELQIGQLAPLRDIQAAVELGAEAGARHRVERLHFDWDKLRVQATGSIGSAAPLPLDASASVTALATGDAAVPWAADLRASGPLARLALEATLRGRAVDAAPAPSLDLRAGVAPFAAWPLLSLSASTTSLDLAALASGAPETRLTGTVEVDARGLDTPISARLVLDNTLAGLWDQGRLPITRAEVALRGQADQRDRLDVQTFDLQLGNGRRSAGRLQGSGGWRGDALQVDARLADVQPQQLDGRAAAMRLSGTVAVGVRGLPSPDPASTAATPPWSATLTAALDGRIDGAPVPVQLRLEAAADALRLELSQFRASAGTARAEGRLSARRVAVAGAGNAIGDTPWQVVTRGSLSNFDPLPWWPGEAGSAWRKGPHRLSAAWQADLRVPAGADRLAPLTLVQRLAGSAELALSDSLLAGVPVAATLTLGNVPGGRGRQTELRGALQLAGNTLTIEGRGDPLGKGATDQWQAALKAADLPALAPIFKLWPALVAWTPTQGEVDASAAVKGRWPVLTTEGQAQLSALKAGRLGVEKASLGWQLGTQGEQPMNVRANVVQLQFGGQKVESLRGGVAGTLLKHRIDVEAALPLAPPAALEQALGLRTLSGARAGLAGEGAWLADPKGGGRWVGQVSRLAAGAWDGKPASGAVPADWLDANDLRAEMHFNADGRLDRLEAAAGRLRLAEAVDLRWDEVLVDTRGALPRIQLRAEVDTFSVAPLLARLQPAMGWTGDLQIGARIELNAAERFDAEVMIERRDGDLRIASDAGVQPLGLSDLRLAMTARDGRWTLAQALAGTALGEAAGAVSLQTTPERRWPAPDTPINGVLQARVANLGVWGTWVPAGWRLSGELATSATIEGTFSAPEYTGEVRGNDLGVRNLLQGINVGPGEVLVQLKGATASIERFTLRAGEGRLDITGGADFGTAPNARLTVNAQRFRLLGRVDRQLIVSGSSELVLRAGQVKLDGNLGIDEGLFDISSSNAPTLDSDVTVRRAGDAEPDPDAAAMSRPRREAQVSVEIDLGEQLRLRGRGIDTGLRGRLNVSTPGGRLTVRGTINTEGGTYAAYGQRLQVERGVVAFTGPVDNPRLDVLALRPNLDVRVGVAITGTAQIPRVRLYSDPDMSDTDKLSWLMLGRASDGLAGTDTALLQRAALALLAGEGEAPTDTFLRNLGLDELSVRAGDGDARETVITVGKQISRRWFVGYERGINAAAGTWQLIYRVAQRFTLRAQSGESNSIDLIWIWRLGQIPLPAARVPESPGQPP